MIRNGCDADIFSEYDKTLLYGIHNVAPNYVKDHKEKDGSTALDYILYRHVKEMVCNHTK